MCPKQVLNLGTGKLDVKVYMKKWGVLGGKSMRILLLLLLLLLLLMLLFSL